VGEQIKVYMGTNGRGATLKVKLLTVNPAQELRWKGHLWVTGLFDGEHSFLIKPQPKGKVLFIQREVFGGLFLPFLTKTLKDTEKEFLEMGKIIKQKAEEKTK
jgi:hypothetical protein